MARQRTVAEVLEAQSRAAAGGCCDRFADQKACDCLARAGKYEYDLRWNPDYAEPQPGGDGPFPPVHPRAAAVQSAEGECSQFLAGWAKRHGLTRAEYLMILGREFARDLERAVATERRAT